MCVCVCVFKGTTYTEALAPPAAILMGKFEELKGLSHDNLCEYIELAKGKHGTCM